MDNLDPAVSDNLINRNYGSQKSSSTSIGEVILRKPGDEKRNFLKKIVAVAIIAFAGGVFYAVKFAPVASDRVTLSSIGFPLGCCFVVMVFLIAMRRRARNSSGELIKETIDCLVDDYSEPSLLTFLFDFAKL